MQDRFEKLYNYMLENGELKKMFPRMTGEWEKDSKKFIYEQQELEKALGIDVTK